MCAVSAIHDYYRQNVPVHQWTPERFDEYKEIVRRLDELDKKMGQPDCEDPAKAAWMREVEARLAELEKRSGPAPSGEAEAA